MQDENGMKRGVTFRLLLLLGLKHDKWRPRREKDRVTACNPCSSSQEEFTARDYFTAEAVKVAPCVTAVIWFHDDCTLLLPCSGPRDLLQMHSYFAGVKRTITVLANVF